MQLVLSTFTGAGLLDMAFEQEGFCVVSLGDIIFGRDIREQHVPSGKFDGVVGGPPCQEFSELAKLVRNNGHSPKFGNRIPEFVRIVEEAQPQWFIMENVMRAPDPTPAGYLVDRQDLKDCDYGGHTMRRRRIWFGTRDGRPLPICSVPRNSLLPVEMAVTGNARVMTTGGRIRARDRRGNNGGGACHEGKLMPLADMVELQGLPADFLKHSPFKAEAIRQMIGNGVPLSLGRAIAKAVTAATASPPQAG